MLLIITRLRARAIRFRQDGNEAVGGFFSQIGQLYMVHHLWAYKDLQTREDIRNAAWHKHGWEELVYYTGNTFINIKLVILLILLFYVLSPQG